MYTRNITKIAYYRGKIPTRDFRKLRNLGNNRLWITRKTTIQPNTNRNKKVHCKYDDNEIGNEEEGRGQQMWRKKKTRFRTPHLHFVHYYRLNGDWRKFWGQVTFRTIRWMSVEYWENKLANKAGELDPHFFLRQLHQNVQ